jgi:transposase
VKHIDRSGYIARNRDRFEYRPGRQIGTTAVTFVAEIGDVRRCETPRQLMAYLGLMPSERSTGHQVRRGSITKAGNPRARRVRLA